MQAKLNKGRQFPRSLRPLLRRPPCSTIGFPISRWLPCQAQILANEFIQTPNNANFLVYFSANHERERAERERKGQVSKWNHDQWDIVLQQVGRFVNAEAKGHHWPWCVWSIGGTWRAHLVKTHSQIDFFVRCYL